MLYKILCGFALLLCLFVQVPKTLADSLHIPAVVIPETRTPKEYAKDIVVSKWDESQWKHFENLIQRESKWKPNAQNPNSTAYGLGQFLNSTWKTVGCVKTEDPYKQIDCTIEYVSERYKTPDKAIKFHIANNYY